MFPYFFFFFAGEAAAPAVETPVAIGGGWLKDRSPLPGWEKGAGFAGRVDDKDVAAILRRLKKLKKREIAKVYKVARAEPTPAEAAEIADIVAPLLKNWADAQLATLPTARAIDWERLEGEARTRLLRVAAQQIWRRQAQERAAAEERARIEAAVAAAEAERRRMAAEEEDAAINFAMQRRARVIKALEVLRALEKEAA